MEDEKETYDERLQKIANRIFRLVLSTRTSRANTDQAIPYEQIFELIGDNDSRLIASKVLLTIANSPRNIHSYPEFVSFIDVMLDLGADPTYKVDNNTMSFVEYIENIRRTYSNVFLDSVYMMIEPYKEFVGKRRKEKKKSVRKQKKKSVTKKKKSVRKHSR